MLFPFDDYAIPFRHGVELSLQGHQGRGRMVLEPGSATSPDCEHIAYYGTVKRVGGEFWMWYLEQAAIEDNDQDPWFQRVCFAKSKDGFSWEKPNLGLVEFKGSKENNLVNMRAWIGHVSACVVFYEPADPYSGRRFQLAFADRRYRNQLAVAFSSDGLSWSECPNNPVGTWLEMAGGTKVEDAYSLSGQGGMHIKNASRQFATHISYDFENWSLASSLGLQRSTSVTSINPVSNNGGKQIHLGAGLWNRGNVIIGFYGLWIGHPSNDRRMVNMDPGLCVSHDALHYREPIPNFPIVSAAEDSWKPLPDTPHLAKFPALMQGQGFKIIGDETLFWYAPWPEQKSDGIRVAVWPLDRLGYFQAYSHGPLVEGNHLEPHIITAPIDLEDVSTQVSLNLDIPNEHCGVSVEILDHRFVPIEGYVRTDCQAPTQSGFRQIVR